MSAISFEGQDGGIGNNQHLVDGDHTNHCDGDAVKRILLVSAIETATGNLSTMQRVASYLTKTSTIVDIVDLGKLEQQLQQPGGDHLLNAHYSAAIGIHAFRSGKLLVQLDIPYALVLGGTDVNVDVSDPMKREVMEAALTKAVKIVAFTEELSGNCLNVWPEFGHKFVNINPSHSTLSPNPSFSLHRHLGIPQETKVFLLPCSLRPVKNPMYLFQAFEKWCQEDSHSNRALVIVGPRLSNYTEYANEFFCALEKTEGVLYCEPLTAQDLHAAMLQSVAVVNSSESEGLSNALLEALGLGVPVIARSCRGNVTLIHHNNHGILYDTPEDFVDKAKSLLNDLELRNKLSENGKWHAQQNYSQESEKTAYRQLLEQLADYRSQSL